MFSATFIVMYWQVAWKPCAVAGLLVQVPSTDLGLALSVPAVTRQPDQGATKIPATAAPVLSMVAVLSANFRAKTTVELSCQATSPAAIRESPAVPVAWAL